MKFLLNAAYITLAIPAGLILIVMALFFYLAAVADEVVFNEYT